MQANFLRHEGYLGAIGAFLEGTTAAVDTSNFSWTENLYGSSSFQARVANCHYLSKYVITKALGRLLDRYQTDIRLFLKS